MSLLNSNSKRSSKPVFPYAVLPETKPSSGKKRVLVLVLMLVVAVVAVGGLLLLG